VENERDKMTSVLRMIYWIPLIGALVREAVEGPDEARLFFLVNVLMGACLLVMCFGYPALLIIALTGAVIVSVLLLWVTFS
jgi:uncharacterized membrane protein